MHKLEALRIFCVAAQMQHFRQAAQTLGVSPQVVTRAVADLEALFGEPLFIRNTRSTAITPFGQQVREEAVQALSQADALFQRFSLAERVSEAGLVRVDVPQIDDFCLVDAVLETLRDHPDIQLDWRSGNRYSNTDREQIDVGVRVGPVPNTDLIVKPIAPLRLQTVMAPALLARLGEPRSVADLRLRYPLAGLLNSNSGKVFEWDFACGSFVPEQPAFVANEQRAMMQAVLHGRAVGQFAAWSVTTHVAAGRLRPVLAGQQVTLDWQLYVYRPRRHQHTARVKRVFDALVGALQAAFEA